MNKEPIFPKKENKKPYTLRLSVSLRKQAEAVAKLNGVSLAVVVEQGIRLAVEHAKAQSKP